MAGVPESSAGNTTRAGRQIAARDARATGLTFRKSQFRSPGSFNPAGTSARGARIRAPAGTIANLADSGAEFRCSQVSLALRFP